MKDTKLKPDRGTARSPATAGGEHGWGETRDWYPGDQRLRRHGWRIVARPRGGPAVWGRGEARLTAAEAGAVCDREEREALEARGA